MKLFDWPQFLDSVPLMCVNVRVGVCYYSGSLHGSPSSPSTSGMLDGVTCDLLLAEMQAMRQGGPVIGVSCQDGAVCLCVCVLCTCQRGCPPTGWHILKSLMRLMQEEMGLALRPVERWKGSLVWVNHDLKWIWSKSEKKKNRRQFRCVFCVWNPELLIFVIVPLDLICNEYSYFTKIFLKKKKRKEKKFCSPNLKKQHLIFVSLLNHWSFRRN